MIKRARLVVVFLKEDYDGSCSTEVVDTTTLNVKDSDNNEKNKSPNQNYNPHKHNTKSNATTYRHNLFTQPFHKGKIVDCKWLLKEKMILHMT